CGAAWSWIEPTLPLPEATVADLRGPTDALARGVIEHVFYPVFPSASRCCSAGLVNTVHQPDALL
ncbi:hypothetical protein, partial [Parafrigoribacterium mesophilum]|uniref:hypothetical protein n=1 Tax=Parafrigoribacterium mesophilum TaxID=433646 RepID=UPI0031FC953F